MNIPEKNLTCVYCIENVHNGKKYIGSTNEFRSRIQTHYRLLKKGIHNSPIMQRDFDAGDAFVVVMLKEFKRTTYKNDMLAFEREAIIEANSVECGYNIGIPGAHHAMKQKTYPAWDFDMKKIKKLLQPLVGYANIHRRAKIRQLCKILECEPADIMVFTGETRFDFDDNWKVI